MNLMTLLKPKGEIEYLHKEDTLRQGLERMRIYGYTALPVIDEDGCYAGSVNEGDFLCRQLTEQPSAFLAFAHMSEHLP